MSDKTTDHNPEKHPGGRPTSGYENKTYRITVRLERYVYEELKAQCRRMGVKPSDAIREAIRLFLREYRKER